MRILQPAPRPATSTPGPIADESLVRQTEDCSLVRGGPLYRLWLRTHLTGEALELLPRRITVLTLLAWAPLLALSILEGHAWGRSVALSFVHDVAMHVRLLLALPLLIGAELVVHQRMRTVWRQFPERGLIPDLSRPRFDGALTSAMRLRDSVTAEALLLATVLVIGVAFWEGQPVLDVSSWYGVPVAGRLRPSLAGWWLGCVSLPIFQFLLLRWYLRLYIWTRFLWQVSRIELTIVPTHPDRCGGLGFLAEVSTALTPLLLAQGALLAGFMANRILYAGAALPEFELEVIGLVILMILAILGPQLVFAPKLAAAKRAGLRDYGALAQRYVREFDDKWVHRGAKSDEPLLGSGDIQSLADLGNSFEVVRGMRFVAFTWQTVLQLAAATLLPTVPLTLTMFSLQELLERLFKLFF